MNPVPIVVALVFAGLCSCGAAVKPAPTVKPRVVRVLPHDPLAFTQGLFYDSGTLYESTGLYGNSTLRAIDAQSGAISSNTLLDAHIFAEGCARMGSELVQITWREQVAIVYSFPALAKLRTATYAGEGWGLTADKDRFYMSTGSDTIFLRDRSFGLAGSLPVRLNGAPLMRLNELEFARNRIYANVWYCDSIFEINPKSGAVTRIIDCSEIIRQEKPTSEEQVLNGIAFDPKSGLFYITGKKWSHVYVVQIAD